MQIPCPGCGEQLPISDDLLGQKIRCGGCQRVVDIPKSVGDSENEAGAAKVAPVQLIETPEATESATSADAETATPASSTKPPAPAADHPADSSATMLVDCACGNRSRVPTASSGSQVRCPSCQRLMRIPKPPAPGAGTFMSGSAFPAALPAQGNAAVDSIAQAPIDHPFLARPKKPPVEASNVPIIATAICCLLGLALVVVVAIVLDKSAETPEVVVEEPDSIEPVVDETDSLAPERVALQEGYSLFLPDGCEPVSREETSRGYTVYRFRNEQGFVLTIAIIPDDSIDRYSTPPLEISQTVVKGVRGLDVKVEEDVQPKRVMVNRMPASVFRFYERSYTDRIYFTHVMVVMDNGKKIVLNFTGKNGTGETVTPPQHWYDSLLTLRNDRDTDTTDVAMAFDPVTDEPSTGRPEQAEFEGNVTMLDAGYSINVPKEFKPIERNEYRGGEIRYEFRSGKNELMVRVKPSEHSNARSNPPVVLGKPPGNVQGAIVEVGGRYYFKREDTEFTILDGMTSCVCRVDHEIKDTPGTYERGFFAIAMDDRKVVFVQITGPMTGTAPESWRSSAKSLRHQSGVQKSQMPAAFQRQ